MSKYLLFLFVMCSCLLSFRGYSQLCCINVLDTKYTSPTYPGGSDASFEVVAKGEFEPYKYSIDGGRTYQNTALFSNLKPGEYTVRIQSRPRSTCSRGYKVSVPDIVISADRSAEVWHFGSRGGLDFSGGRPVAIDGFTREASEGTAVLCDEKGKLLLASDGRTVWNGWGSG